MLMETDPQVSTSEHSFMWERLLKISNSIPYKKEISIFFDDGQEEKQKKMVSLYNVVDCWSWTKRIRCRRQNLKSNKMYTLGGSKQLPVTRKYTYFQRQNTK